MGKKQSHYCLKSLRCCGAFLFSSVPEHASSTAYFFFSLRVMLTISKYPHDWNTQTNSDSWGITMAAHHQDSRHLNFQTFISMSPSPAPPLFPCLPGVEPQRDFTPDSSLSLSRQLDSLIIQIVYNLPKHMSQRYDFFYYYFYSLLL